MGRLSAADERLSVLRHSPVSGLVQACEPSQKGRLGVAESGALQSNKEARMRIAVHVTTIRRGNKLIGDWRLFLDRH